NPGATFRGIHDSIVNYGGNTQPELLQCCHEEVAVALAHGYAKAAGKPMAAILHNVVGLQHASMAIFNAWCDRAPMLVMGGTGPMAVEQRRPWIDWIHTALVQGQAVRDFVKWDDQPASLASIPEAIIRGYRIAMTEPKGPVYLCFDAALQEMPLSEDVPVPEVARYAAPARADRLTRRSEPVLPESAKVIHITMADVAVRSWVTAYQRLAPVDVPILADTAAALPVLMARLRTLGVDGEAAGRRPRAERLRARHEALRREARTACEESWNDRPIAPARLASEVWDVLRGEDWVLVNGTLDGWARSLWEWVHPHQYLGNSGGAGLGYGAGASIGAALAHRGTGRVCVDLQ